LVADHADAHALQRSFERSYAMAGVKDPQQQVDVAELYAPFSNTEFHSIEAAGLAGLGKSAAQLREGRFSLGGEIPVNPSGGTLCTNAIAVTAMIRAAGLRTRRRAPGPGRQARHRQRQWRRSPVLRHHGH
jgi:acetyl-CoA C-acetyltransferase